MSEAAGRSVRRVGVPGLAIAALVLLVLAIGSLVPAIGVALDQQHQIAATRASIASQRSQIRELDARIAQWGDPAYLRAEAGSRLLFVIPGETTYRLVGRAPAAAATAPAAAAADPGWAAALYASVVAAGR